MSDVFISYKSEDVARVALLVQALQRDGFNIWWDQSLPGGEAWRDNIHNALDNAKCVIVVWTKASAGRMGDFVRDEASRARDRGVLVPIVLERGTRPPLGFGEVQAIDLSHWRGNRNDPFYKDLTEACRAKIESRPARPAKAKVQRLARRLGIATAVSTGTGFLAAFAMNALNSQDLVCSVQIGQPAVSDTCGLLNLGKRPTREGRLAFEALPSGSCEALSEYRAKYESSPLRDIVDSRLADKRLSDQPVWSPRNVDFPLTPDPEYKDYKTKAAAQSAAIEIGQKEGQSRCGLLETSGRFKISAIKIVPSDWMCEASPSGHRCNFSGAVTCETLEKIDVYECGETKKLQ